MASKAHNSYLRTGLALFLLCATQSLAQPTDYRPVRFGDTLRDGEPIEIGGYFWIEFVAGENPPPLYKLHDRPRGFLLPNPASAVVGIEIDVDGLAPDLVRRLSDGCGVVRQRGCRATIRGVTALLGKRQGIVAHDIHLTP